MGIILYLQYLVGWAQNRLVSMGGRVVSGTGFGTFLFTLTTGFYGLIVWFINSVYDAVAGIILEVPLVVDEVTGALTPAKSALGAGSAGQWFSWVNYVLPIDFLATCLCLYFSLWVACFTLSLFMKFLGWIKTINPIS